MTAWMSSAQRPDPEQEEGDNPDLSETRANKLKDREIELLKNKISVLEEKLRTPASSKESGFLTPRDAPITSHDLIDLSTPPGQKLEKEDKMVELENQVRALKDLLANDHAKKRKKVERTVTDLPEVPKPPVIEIMNDDLHYDMPPGLDHAAKKVDNAARRLTSHVPASPPS